MSSIHHLISRPLEDMDSWAQPGLELLPGKTPAHMWSPALDPYQVEKMKPKGDFLGRGHLFPKESLSPVKASHTIGHNHTKQNIPISNFPVPFGDNLPAHDLEDTAPVFGVWGQTQECLLNTAPYRVNFL